MPSSILWYVLLSPLLSALLILLFAHRSRGASVFLSLAAVAVSFGSAVCAFLQPQEALATGFNWVDLGESLNVSIGLQADPMSKVMLLVVTGIGLLVHVYSAAYMADDPSKSRFFGSLSLFMFSMLGIVLADNLLMLFIFWELVGVSSFLLIGHWFEKRSASGAANKAFLTNRIGDFGFMIGILLVWHATNTVNIAELKTASDKLIAHPEILTAAALCLFCGTIGKSAQFPLHVWLPDAMEGPTPVSALIHAATMVAAGVYLTARLFFLIEPSPTALSIIAGIGAITAVLAALMATQQDDIKRILAYSTLSQLGYMVAAVGVGAPAAAMFHLFTHAFFKELLFLGAGSVIHAMHHEQDIWKMGGLRAKMPLTFNTFVIGTLALTGCPFLAGFFSKDAILMAAWDKSPLIFWPALITAALTAFYMTRLVIVAFLGSPRNEAVSHAHESPALMTLPLVVLMILSVIGGYSAFAERIFGHDLFHQVHAAPHSNTVLVLALSSFVVGTAIAWRIYRHRNRDPLSISLFKNRFYFDEVYESLIRGTQEMLASFLAWFDEYIVGGVVVRGISSTVWGVGYLVRLTQLGNLQVYTLLFGLGTLVLLFLINR
jgi:NADH-quinone oxidoreductase subunit L